jgi:hypothetical protein
VLTRVRVKLLSHVADYPFLMGAEGETFNPESYRTVALKGQGE